MVVNAFASIFSCTIEHNACFARLFWINYRVMRYVPNAAGRVLRELVGRNLACITCTDVTLDRLDITFLKFAVPL